MTTDNLKKKMEDIFASQQQLTNFFKDSPLYAEVEIEASDVSMRVLYKALYDDFQFDCHCPYCKKESTFKKIDFNTWAYEAFLQSKVPKGYIQRDVKFECQRDTNHEFIYCLYFDGSSLVKYGQLPSLETVGSADIQKYKSVLPSSYFSDLHRAGGLASHGIGAGSFIYLRRIFEKLIHDHKDSYELSNGPIEGFSTLRMDEKIEALKGVLPPLLSKYKSVYSILSKGVHELDENTCRKFFPIVKAAIVAILEQDLQEKAKADSEKKLHEEMAKITSELKGGQG